MPKIRKTSVKHRHAPAKPRDDFNHTLKISAWGGGGRAVPVNMHLGEFLREEFMKPLGLTPEIVAKAIPEDPEFQAADYAAQIHELLLADEDSFISISLALALDRYFGLSPGYFWRAQAAHDLRKEQHRSRKWLAKVKPLASSKPRFAREPVADLDGNQLVEQGTAFLRSKETGRLDAKKIAKLYDEPLKRFSEVLGVSLAAIRRTPDSKEYQLKLDYFERAARIIPLLDSKDMFAAWAKTPNKRLKGAAPIEWLFAGPGKAQQLVEIVEDVLVGQPD